jgi:hypothetical protein
MSSAKSVLMFPVVFALVLLLIAPSLSGTSLGSGSAGKEVRLLFAGDILLSRGVERRLSRDARALDRALLPTLSGADWAIGNLEGAAGSPDDCREPARDGPCFPIRGEFIPFLRHAGFEAIGLANNHASDLGEAGRETTRRLLCQNGLLSLTYEDSPQFVRFGDLTVGIVAFSLVAGRGEVPLNIPDTGLRRRLRLARNLSNLLVVYVHWGSEFLDWPDKKQRQTAEWLVDNGVDLIVGHHPHLVQKPEILHGKAVFYSLGNLVFDQKYPSTREGLIADCRVSGDTVSCSLLPTRTSTESTMPIIEGTGGKAEKTLSGYQTRLAPPLVVNGIALKPLSASAGAEGSGLRLEAIQDGKTLWKTPHARIFSLEPMKIGKPQTAEYLLTLERHFSPLDKEEGLRPCVYEVSREALIPKWRGTALAWPLVDAAVLPGDDGILCALHRGDSFIAPKPGSNEQRVAAYRWKGFGFSGIQDPEVIRSCRDFIGFPDAHAQGF